MPEGPPPEAKDDDDSDSDDSIVMPEGPAPPEARLVSSGPSAGEFQQLCKGLIPRLIIRSAVGSLTQLT